MLFEKNLIEHCSPTLAHLKTGNIFTISFSTVENLEKNILLFDEILCDKGVNIFVLRVSLENKKALVYVYRKSKLSESLKNRDIFEFLNQYGYNSSEIDNALFTLKNRLSESKCFPHEIGIFLGYPLKDIEAFILNNGKDFIYCGHWKVYANCSDCLKKFERFDKCKMLYRKLWERGYSIKKLTVMA